MGTYSKKRPENVSGNFYVDSTCIDCETCRIIAPSTFSESGGRSYVYHQPESEEMQQEALRALVACPTSSIGTEFPMDLHLAKSSFPYLLRENIYYCGFHSKSSYGAFSYLIKRADGNVLVDSPRYVPSLAEKMEEMGGVYYHFLTHQDDVADHSKFHDKFSTQRIIHESDASAIGNPEISIAGSEPYRLADSLEIIPTPGHTRGHAVLLYNNSVLFTGDHLAYDPNRERLIAFRNACWYSWKEQIHSMEKLMDYTFEWILPGHGHWYHGTASDVKSMLKDCIQWMKDK
ncbi:MBL fold metallo-hydrolase [Leptospira perolatii]|uniref:MBL fold metallo-hydrolase n=1 Tax=Leptospira perolatii TaxID=2023191 RepID=A0A2M9ZIT6_9LEPT|nr:MBL fold metallo-hydrolase [Leptospira perolatii]PJZ68622.1 MBL fold metallo-hydrolase [Leptospira perolatii]PJZ71969.1 MBL fold metallo-hydrolase [Leptospira perolatii]